MTSQPEGSLINNHQGAIMGPMASESWLKGNHGRDEIDTGGAIVK